MSDLDRSRQLVIGCGTGRCGTVSLMKFLNSHAGITMYHEGAIDGRGHHLLPWRGGEAQLHKWLTELEGYTGNTRWYGDIGPYFLPYLPEILKFDPEARVICLERNKSEVIKSFLRKTAGRNHWYKHGGIGWTEDPEWDPSFPHYAEPDKSRALGLYWDYYHSTAAEYRALFPDNFLFLPTLALNKTSGRLKILEFIGYDGPTVSGGIFKANAARKNGLRQLPARLTALFRSDKQS